MQSADQIGLPQYVQSKPFSHKLWYPPNFTVDPLSLSTITDPAGSGDEISVTVDVLQGKRNSASQEEDMNASNVFKKKKKLRDENVTQWLGDKVLEEYFAWIRSPHDIVFEDHCGCHRGRYWGGVYVRGTG